MEFTETPLGGAYLIRPKKIADERGFFARLWCQEELRAHGLNPNALQLNVGFSHKRGTFRGLHYQTAPHAEAKLIRCTRGAVFDVIVDLRPHSPTCGQWFGAELAHDNYVAMYAPEGFAHGYQTLTDDAEICYLTTAAYAASAATGVRYDDLALGIRLPIPVAVISEPDRRWPDFRR
jgi:dTDP-4-dehydrorhamnose 3,5-epimerase